MTIPRIAIVTGCYNEEESLPAYFETVGRVLLDRTDADYHVLLVDDGSTDRTWELIRLATASSPRFRGLRFSRNFGAYAADTAALDRVDADAVVTLSADLQDPPETIIEFVEAWRRGAQIVWGARLSRDDSRWRILASKMFLWAIRRFVLPTGSKAVTGGFLLVDRKVVECLRTMREHNRVTFALAAWTGFDQAVVEYHRGRRLEGTSRFTFSRMLRAMYDVFIAFSHVLPRAITVLGLACSSVAFLASIFLLVMFFVAPPMVLGWTSLMIALLFFAGVTFCILGVMSEYLSRIYIESTRRPLYVVSADTQTDG